MIDSCPFPRSRMTLRSRSGQASRRILFTTVLGLLLLTACSSRGRVRREVTIGNEVMKVVMPTGKGVVHPTYGKEEWFAVGAIKGEGDTKANGVAQSHVFANGTTIATVNVNIHEAPSGYTFIAWLQKPGSQERIRLDALQNPLNDVRHLITAEVEKDLRGYTSVLVTKEGTGGPMETDPIVATGVLKVQER